MAPLTLLAFTFTLAQQAAVPQQAAVSGTVLEAGTNTPVAGAQVTLMSFALRPQPGRPPQPLVAMTDQNGRYQFENLEPGRYRVSVQKAGFATMLGAGLPEATLNAGERRADLNITIQRGAVIVGHVLDENGEPIVNANVLAWRRPSIPSGAVAAARLGLIPAGPAAPTNDLGEFRLFGLPAGELYVQATSPDFGRPGSPRPTVQLPTYFPGTADAAGAMPITLTAGQTSGDITIRMISAPAFQISGVVTDEGGRPVENALVRLLVETAPGEPPMRFMGRMQSARSDKAGHFTISGVVNGSYTLLAIAPVVLPTRDASGGAAAGTGTTSMSFRSDTVTGGVVGGVIGGAVTTETVNGMTTQYRDDAGTRVTVTVNDASVAGVAMVVRAAAR